MLGCTFNLGTISLYVAVFVESTFTDLYIEALFFY